MATSVSERFASRLPSGGTAVPLWARAAGLYLGLSLVSWLLLRDAAGAQAWFPGVTGPREGDVDLALSWDAQWYRRIAEDGYPAELPVGPDGRVQQNEWAFYPLYPVAVRVVTLLTGLGFATAAPLLSLLAGLGAAVVMARLFVETLPSRSEDLALAAVAVWAASPVSPVLQLAYTESLSMLLLVTVLLLLVREQWWWAGACALLLGLARPIAPPLVVVTLVALWLRWRVRCDRPVPGHERAAMLGALVLTGASGALWTVLAAVGTGRRDAYPATMTAWRGEDTIQVWEPWKQTVEWAWQTHDRVFVLPAVAMVGAALGSLLLLAPRVAPAVDVRLRVWSAAYAVYLLAVVDGHTSIFRYLLPLFPLALVLVGAHRPRGGADGSRWWWLRTWWWVVIGVAGQVAWIWWLVLFEPPSDFPP